MRDANRVEAGKFGALHLADAMFGADRPPRRSNEVVDEPRHRIALACEPVGIATRAVAADWFRSTARWRVVETLKGGARAGDVLQVRMVSGEEADGRIAQGNDEPPVLPGLPGSLAAGGRWLLHLNDALYAHAAFIHGGAGAVRAGERRYVQTLTAAPVMGEQVGGPFFGQKPFALGELRRALAPLQAAVVASGTAGGNAR